jgi:hypothetical protein
MNHLDDLDIADYFAFLYGGWFVPIYDLSSFHFVAAKRRQNDKTTKRKVDKTTK